jgi:hypothetical protein
MLVRARVGQLYHGTDRDRYPVLPPQTPPCLARVLMYVLCICAFVRHTHTTSGACFRPNITTHIAPVYARVPAPYFVCGSFLSSCRLCRHSPGERWLEKAPTQGSSWTADGGVQEILNAPGRVRVFNSKRNLIIRVKLTGGLWHACKSRYEVLTILQISTVLAVFA